MQDFDTWVQANHPEYYEEGWKNWAAGAAVLGGLALGANHMMSSPSAPQQQPVQQRQVMGQQVQGHATIHNVVGGGKTRAFQDARHDAMQQLAKSGIKTTQLQSVSQSIDGDQLTVTFTYDNPGSNYSGSGHSTPAGNNGGGTRQINPDAGDFLR